MITKKHYIKIAEILGNNNASDKMVNDFARYFREDNPAFKIGKFTLAVEDERHNHNMAEEAKFLQITATA